MNDELKKWLKENVDQVFISEQIDEDCIASDRFGLENHIKTNLAYNIAKFLLDNNQIRFSKDNYDGFITYYARLPFIKKKKI